MSTGVATTKEIKSVQASTMTSQITIPTNKFSTRNLMPYFQLPTQNPPLGFGNSRGGIPMKDNGSPPHGTPHGSGRPPRGGNGPLGKGGGPLSESRPIGRNGGKFSTRDTSVPFNVP
jgi:hypothetical protein